MSVENILYVVAFIIFFIISTYRNYKKQEEQRKKAQEVRREEMESSEKQVFKEPAKTKPSFEDILGELLDIPPAKEKEYQPYEQPTVEKYKEPKPVEVRRAEPVYKPVIAEHPKTEEKYKAEMPEEVTKVRAAHATHKHYFEFPKAEEESYTDFDLRDAVIKQIILEPKFKA
jgi:hypothetical protein